VRIIFILDATFVPNLTFLGLLNSEISFGEKTDTHPDTQLISPFVKFTEELMLHTHENPPFSWSDQMM